MTLEEQHKIEIGLLKRKSSYLTNILKAQYCRYSEKTIMLLKGFKNDLNRDIYFFKMKHDTTLR